MNNAAESSEVLLKIFTLHSVKCPYAALIPLHSINNVLYLHAICTALSNLRYKIKETKFNGKDRRATSSQHDRLTLETTN
jgi:hypothetical protein